MASGISDTHAQSLNGCFAFTFMFYRLFVVWSARHDIIALYNKEKRSPFFWGGGSKLLYDKEIEQKRPVGFPIAPKYSAPKMSRHEEKELPQGYFLLSRCKYARSSFQRLNTILA